MTPLRVAVIGAGGIASRHLANLAWFPGVRLVAVADPVIEAAEGQARRVAGARPFTDWREMLDTVQPEVLLICVPPFAHGEPELAAVERGLPFFVEKPIAADLATAERIGDAVAARGLVTAVGYHWRYLDTTERAAELLAEKPAHLAMGYWWDSTPPRAWWVKQSTSGGQIVEQTTHIFDLARVLVGEAEVVSTTVRHAPGRERAFPDADVPDASLVSVIFDSGAIGTFASTHLLGWPHRVGLHLVSDRMVLELSEAELMVDVGRGRPITRPSRDPFLAELRDFLDAATGGENRIRAPFAEALRTQRLTVAATNAAISGRLPGSATSAERAPVSVGR
jgi:predicted dehydrogenase